VILLKNYFVFVIINKIATKLKGQKFSEDTSSHMVYYTDFQDSELHQYVMPLLLSAGHGNI
jgi:hypothetical protein